MEGQKPTTIDAYISTFPETVQQQLKQIRLVIQQAVPEATEAIKYDIPTFVYHGNMMSFAAFKKHIGVYPAPRNEELFKDELANYKGNKSTVQFPLDKPVPLDLVARIAQYNKQRMLKKAK